MIFIRSLILLCFIAVWAPKIEAVSQGIAAIEQAKQENKYLFLLLYKEQNERTAKTKRTVAQALLKVNDKAKLLTVDVKDPSEAAVVERFQLKRSPTPFVLVVAPNGAITGSYLSNVTEQQLVEALVSEGTTKILKALQGRKLVILALQNNQTTNNEAALKGAKDFKADERFGPATEIVQIDPRDTHEQIFLKQLALDAPSSQAMTVLISPPSDVIGKYVGATNKAQMVADLQKATSNCCCPGGCCPGGCCPGGCCK